MSAWDRFFCSSCQIERHISLKVRVGKFRTACQVCNPRRHKGGDSVKSLRSWAEDWEVKFDTELPSDALEAYRESQV